MRWHTFCLLKYMVYQVNTNSFPGDESLISLSYLNVLSQGDRNFEKEIIEFYLKQTPSTFEKLEKAVEDANFELIRYVSHKLRPSFSLMGIKENDLLKTIEDNALNRSGLEKIQLDFLRLKEIYEKSFVSIKKVLKKIIEDA